MLTSPQGQVRKYLITHGVRQGSKEGPILLQLGAERSQFESWTGLLLLKPGESQIGRRAAPATTAARAMNPGGRVDLSETVFADGAAAGLLFATLRQVSTYLWCWNQAFAGHRMVISFPKTKLRYFGTAARLQRSIRTFITPRCYLLPSRAVAIARSQRTAKKPDETPEETTTKQETTQQPASEMGRKRVPGQKAASA